MKRTLSTVLASVAFGWGTLSAAPVLAAPVEQPHIPVQTAPSTATSGASVDVPPEPQKAMLRARYVVPATDEQLRVELRRQGALLEAALCQVTCAWHNAAQWTLPEPFVDVPADFRVVNLGHGRRAGRLVVLLEHRQYEVIVAAPRAVSPSGAVPAGAVPAGAVPASAVPNPSGLVVAFAGETGLSQGEAPDRSGTVVQVLPESDDESHIVIGTVREDVSLCGRQALLVPKVLHPDSLSLRRVRLHRIPKQERDAAQRLQPAPLGARVPSSVFTPLVASSANGSPSALTDGDRNTTWTENRGGDGSGEFVVMRAPRSVGLTGIVLSKPSLVEPGYAPPRTLWVVTDDAVFHLDLSGSEPSGQQWYVPFPDAVNTGCLAIALDTAHAPEVAASASAETPPPFDVGLAELAATTDVDEARLDRALAELDTGGDQAAAAERLLMAVGQSAFVRVKKRYRGYSQSGRMRALNVMDAATCRVAVPVYIQALYSQQTAESKHGERRLTECKNQAVPMLAKRLPKVGSARARALSSALVRLDPVRGVEAITPLLSQGPRQKRRVLRQAFTKAVLDEQAAARVRKLLSDPALDLKQGLPLMRALGDALPRYRDLAVQPLLGWLSADDFETRYLLIEPVARLARFSEALAKHLAGLLRHADDPVLRAETARRAPALRAIVPDLVKAVSDPHVRVREAAVVNAGEQALESARPALLLRLKEDPWPIVRAAAVRALAQLPAQPMALQQLAETAREDESPMVRRPALHVLGRLGARSEASAVREAFEEDADMHVRATAAATLGVLCDHTMTQALTERAVQFATLSTSEAERVVGKAALSALGRLAPPDLQQRLAPFFGDGVPSHSQSAAMAALSHSNTCVETRTTR